jgi:hypothetical protein
VYLSSSPILTPPKKQEDMMLYIAATSTMVNASIVVEREEEEEEEEEGHVYKVQRLVYYVNKVLIDSKIRYRKYKNYSTPSWLLLASYDTTSKVTRLL